MGLRRTLDGALFDAGMLGCLAVERVTRGIVFNPTTAAMHENPHPFYKRLREKDPFHPSLPADGYVLSRYEDVHASRSASPAPSTSCSATTVRCSSPRAW